MKKQFFFPKSLVFSSALKSVIFFLQTDRTMSQRCTGYRQAQVTKNGYCIQYLLNLSLVWGKWTDWNISNQKIQFKTASKMPWRGHSQLNLRCKFWVWVSLLGPFIFTCVNFEEKTNNTVTCLIRPRLVPFRITVSLIIIIDGVQVVKIQFSYV